MKNLLISILILFPLLVYCQSADSTAMAARIDSLVKEGRNLTDIGDFDSALQIIRIAKADAIATFGKASAKYGKCVLVEGRALLIMEKNPEAQQLCLEAKSILEKTLFSF